MVIRLNIDNSSQKNKISKEEKGNNAPIMDEHDRFGSLDIIWHHRTI